MINDYLLMIAIFLFLIMTTRLYYHSREYFIEDLSIEHFDNEESSVKIQPLNRPFCNLYDNNGNLLNVTLLSRPFYAPNHYKDYDMKVKNKFKVLGISSYQEFPNKPLNPKDNYNEKSNIYDKNKWISMCDGWLHCFREEHVDDYLPKNMKKILMSESDFCDCNVNKPDPEVKKKYDFIYICHRDALGDCSTKEWVAFNKNLELAQKCISILCNEKKLKGLLVGRTGCKLPEGCEGFDIKKFKDNDNLNLLDIVTTEKLDYYDLNSKYDEVKLIFIPNIHDASPRVVTEAMAHNIPCLMNENIVGGWKYIKSYDGINELPSGEFFKDESNFKEMIDKMIHNIDKYEPRQFFVSNYGILKTGKKLKQFINEVYGDTLNVPMDKIDYITPEFQKKNYIECSLK